MKLGWLWNTAHFEGLEDEPHEPFRVLILYTARASAIRAMNAVQKIADILGDEVSLECDLWRVDVLNLPEVQHQVRWGGKIADLIIIASELSILSRTVEHWLRRCVAEKRQGASILVQLFNETGDTAGIAPQLQRFLKSYARGLDFFIHEIVPPRFAKTRRLAHPEPCPSSSNATEGAPAIASPDDRESSSHDPAWREKMRRLELIHQEISPQLKSLRAADVLERLNWGG